MSHAPPSRSPVAVSDSQHGQLRQQAQRRQYPPADQDMLGTRLYRMAIGKPALTKQLQFLEHLIASLDTVVMAELCVLYYMDCSTLRLACRLALQNTFLSPRSDDIEGRIPQPLPWASAIVGSSLVCMLLHLFSNLPEGDPSLRGYLHGGVIIDFVGQTPPTSKFGLLMLDVLVLLLQCVMCAARLEEDKLRRWLKEPVTGATSVGSGSGAATSATETSNLSALPRQEYDAEERGIRSSHEFMRGMHENDGEGDSLLVTRTSEMETSIAGAESEEIVAERVQRHQTEMLDRVVSGNEVLYLPRISSALRRLGFGFRSATAYSLQLAGYLGTLAGITARRLASRRG